MIESIMSFLGIATTYASEYTLTSSGVTAIGTASKDVADSLFGTVASLLPVMIPVIVIGFVIGFVRSKIR